MKKTSGLILVLLPLLIVCKAVDASSNINYVPAMEFLLMTIAQKMHPDFHSMPLDGKAGKSGQHNRESSGGATPARSNGTPQRGTSHGTGNHDAGSTGSPGEGDDGEEIPPPEDKADSQEPDQTIQGLHQAMDETLKTISAQITQKKLRLMLVFDIDNTLFRYDTANPLLFDETTLIQVQQDWLQQLNEFYRQHRESIILVYNTARSQPLDPNKKGDVYHAEKSIKESNRIALSISRSKDSPELIEVPLQSNPEKHFKLSPPDYLITGGGAHVQAKDSCEEWNAEGYATNPVNNQITSLNTALSLWLSEDHPALEAAIDVLRKFRFENFRRNLQKTFFKAVTNNYPAMFYAEFNFAQIFKDTQVIHTPIYIPVQGHGKNMMFLHNNSVNKGSTLNALRFIISSTKKPDEPEPGVIIFGDSISDLPMLRPDMEGSALQLLKESAINKKNQRFQEQLGIDMKQYDFYRHWLASIVPNKQIFTNSRNPHIERMFTHPKVLEAPAEGVLGLMQAMSKLLENIAAQQCNMTFKTAS